MNYNQDIHTKIVKLAYAYHRKMRKGSVVEVEDLINAAYYGLLQAEQTYDSEKGPFWPYAKRRCIWRIIDAIRDQSAVYPRKSRHRSYPIQIATSTI